MIDPVQRLVFRGQIHPGREEVLQAALPNLQATLTQRVAADDILTLSLFTRQQQIFLYYECSGDAIAPSDLLGNIDSALHPWPGEAASRFWVPMMDIFHYNQPQSVEHWRRDTPPEACTARIIYLRPEMVSSYIFLHYQMQEEKPGAGDKYGQISIHENLLLFYMEQPATQETAQHEGQLKTQHTPANWHEVMFPHFQPWDDMEEKGKWQLAEGSQLWRPIELFCSV
jgi:hypothetical protein